MTDSPSPRSRYNVSYTLRVTEEMDTRLQQILEKQGRSVSLNDLLRTAIRQFLDEQEDLIGSRRHFSKSLQQSLDVSERRAIFYLTILIYLVAAGFAVLIQAVTRDSKVQSHLLIRAAIASTLKDGAQLHQQIQAVRDEHPS